MKFTFDHDYHIHSQISSCSSDPEQTTERILRYATDNSLSRICLTDHYWDSAVSGASEWYAPQNYERLARALPLPNADGVEFLFGCETDMDRHFRIGIPPERYDDFDFIIIPTTHLHMTGFTIFDEDALSNKRRAALWTERFERLLDIPLPFEKVGVAHLACPLLDKRSRGDYLRTLECIGDSDMERLFGRAAALGCGIELNGCDVNFRESEGERVIRMFRIAKECGCKFYFGSDAHHPKDLLTVRAVFERAADILGLTEDDKFQIKKESKNK